MKTHPPLTKAQVRAFAAHADTVLPPLTTYFLRRVEHEVGKFGNESIILDTEVGRFVVSRVYPKGVRKPLWLCSSDRWMLAQSGDYSTPEEAFDAYLEETRPGTMQERGPSLGDIALKLWRRAEEIERQRPGTFAALAEQAMRVFSRSKPKA